MAKYVVWAYAVKEEENGQEEDMGTVSCVKEFENEQDAIDFVDMLNEKYYREVSF